MTTGLPREHYIRHRKAIEEEGDLRIAEGESWRRKCGLQVLSTAEKVSK